MAAAALTSDYGAAPGAHDDNCHYDFADDEDDGEALEPANGTQSELGDHVLTRQDSSRSMFTFATSTTDEKGGAGNGGSSSPCEPPGTHLDRTQSEPPGRYFSRSGYRSSPGRRRSSSPLPGSRFPAVDGPLVRRSSREFTRPSKAPAPASIEREDKTNGSNEDSRPLDPSSGSLVSKRPSIDSFLDLPEQAVASLPVQPLPPKPANPNPVAVLISDAIRKNEPTVLQDDEAQSRRSLDPLLRPSKLRRDSAMKKKRAKQSKGNASGHEDTREGNVERTPNPVALLVVEAIREKKVKRSSSPAKIRKPNPVAVLVAEALQNKGDVARVEQANPQESSDDGANRSQPTNDQPPEMVSSSTVPVIPLGPDRDPASETDSFKTEGAIAVIANASDDAIVPCSDESDENGNRKTTSTSETSTRRRRDNSPSKRRKSRSKEDIDRSERRRASPEKTSLKRVSSEGQENHRKSPKTKGSVDDYLAGAPKPELKRRNSTGSLDASIVHLSPSTPSSHLRTPQRRTRSPSRARSPSKVSSSSRERSKAKEEILAAHTLHASPSRSRSLTKSTNSARERSKSKADCAATQVMHMSLSNLARKPRSPILRTKSDDKNREKSLHMSLSGLFERDTPHRTRSKSRSVRVSRSNSFTLPEEPEQKISTHRPRDDSSPSKKASDGTTNPSKSRSRRSQSPSPSGRETTTRSRATPSSSRLHRNKERSSALKTPKTAPSRPRRSVGKLQQLPRLALDDDSGDDDRSINLEMLGVSSSHTTSLQLDISNPCLVETMVVATLLPSTDEDSEPELFDTNVFKEAVHKSGHNSLGRIQTTQPRARTSKTKSSLMSSLRDLSPRRLRVDRTVEAG